MCARGSAVKALALKVFRATRTGPCCRTLATALLVPCVLTLMLLGASLAVASLPTATQFVAVNPAAAAGTFLRPEAVRKLGPLVVAAPAADGNGSALLLDAFARALGLAAGTSPGIVAMQSSALVEAQCGANGGGGGPCLAGVVFDAGVASSSAAYTLRLDKAELLSQRYSTTTLCGSTLSCSCRCCKPRPTQRLSVSIAQTTAAG